MATKQKAAKSTRPSSIKMQVSNGSKGPQKKGGKGTKGGGKGGGK